MCPYRPAVLALLATIAACHPGPEAGMPSASRGNPERGLAVDARAPEAAIPESGPGSAQEAALDYMARVRGRGDTPAPGAVDVVPACAGCHGPRGGGDAALHTPRIGGLEEWYIARQLKYFKLGLRGYAPADAYGRYMHSVARLLDTNAQIETLADHYAALNPPPVAAQVDGDLERGRDLYEVCAPCHGADGSGNAELNTPSLAGQSGPYMVRQLENYRAGHRGAKPGDLYGMQMAPIVRSTLTSREDVEDVVAYVRSLGTDGAADEAEAESARSVASP